MAETSATADRLIFERYLSAVDRLDARIQPYSHVSKTLVEVQRLAVAKMHRLESFLAYLGDPHRSYPIVHITGTSGKGSTAAAIAASLTAAGNRTGLHTSPYLQAATEKLQIDTQLLAGDMFADYVEALFDAESSWLPSEGDKLSYGELWAALVFQTMAWQQVDIAVIEVGAGGRFDLTNVVTPVLSVITTVGLDHIDTLGPTIEDIAWHKAGIIKSQVPVVTGVMAPEILSIIAAEAKQMGSPLSVVSQDAISDKPCQTNRTFHKRNLAIAQTASRALEQSGFQIDDQSATTTKHIAQLPGRTEHMQSLPDVLIDGAHNPQKVEALIESLPFCLPVPDRASLICVLGLLGSKDSAAISQLLAEVVDVFVITRPEVDGKPALQPTELVRQLRRQEFLGTIIVEDQVSTATDRAITLCDTNRGDAVLITGSLYVAGSSRERWYETRDIVLERTPWPHADNGLTA